MPAGDLDSVDEGAADEAADEDFSADEDLSADEDGAAELEAEADDWAAELEPPAAADEDEPEPEPPEPASTEAVPPDWPMAPVASDTSN